MSDQVSLEKLANDTLKQQTHLSQRRKHHVVRVIVGGLLAWNVVVGTYTFLRTFDTVIDPKKVEEDLYSGLVRENKGLSKPLMYTLYVTTKPGRLIGYQTGKFFYRGLDG